MTKQRSLALVCLYVAGLSLLGLIGCGARSTVVVVPETASASVHTLLFATNRAPDNGMFGASRSDSATYGSVRVSVPPKHKVGVVEYPGTSADVQSKFGIVEAATTQSAVTFDQLLAQQAAQRDPGKRRVVIFVHGYNNTFAEALYMNTQIIHDYKSTDIPLLFSWPSGGENLGYMHDRDEVMSSRSAFEAVLDQVNAADVESFVIVGHSIGSQLVMETLRQHAIRGGGKAWAKLAGVLLVSPDIDVDVFEQLRKDMGGLPQPFMVIGSKNDRLLAISGVINGGSDRLGTVEDTAALSNDEATVISASFATSFWSANHTTAFASPDMMKLLDSYGAMAGSGG